MTDGITIKNKLVLGAALGVALALAAFSAGLKPAAAEESGSLEVTYLHSEQQSPVWDDVPYDLSIGMRLTPPAGYSFAFETVEEDTAFDQAGDLAALVIFRMVRSPEDCPTGVRDQRDLEFSQDLFLSGIDGNFDAWGLVDTTDGSITAGSNRLDVHGVLGRYVCAAVEVKSDSDPEGASAYSHLLGGKRFALGDITTSTLAAEPELRSAQRPDIPFSLDHVRLPLDMSQIELLVAIYGARHLPENLDYQNNPADYWRYKLVDNRSDCPQAEAVAEMRPGFGGPAEITVDRGGPQSNTSPSKYITVIPVEDVEDVRGKHLCLEVKATDEPVSYSYYASLAIEWSTGLVPDKPFLNWGDLSRAEKMASNPYECADVEQIDENDGRCLDGSGLLNSEYENEASGAGTEPADEASSDNSVALVAGGVAVVLVITGAGWLLFRKKDKTAS